MYMVQRGGIQKVGFLTEPDHGMRARPLDKLEESSHGNECRLQSRRG